jgi:hypothetical protein
MPLADTTSDADGITAIGGELGGRLVVDGMTGAGVPTAGSRSGISASVGRAGNRPPTPDRAWALRNGGDQLGAYATSRADLWEHAKELAKDPHILPRWLPERLMTRERETPAETPAETQGSVEAYLDALQKWLVVPQPPTAGPRPPTAAPRPPTVALRPPTAASRAGGRRAVNSPRGVTPSAR